MVKMTVKMGRTSWIATALLQVVKNKLLNKQRQQKMLYLSVSSFKSELLIDDTFTFATVGQSVYRGLLLLFSQNFSSILIC